MLSCLQLKIMTLRYLTRITTPEYREFKLKFVERSQGYTKKETFSLPQYTARLGF